LTQLSDHTNQWYWGRGVVGPFTFVYFAYLPKDSSVPITDPNAWYTSGFLSQDGAEIVNFCSAEQNNAEHAQRHITIKTRGAIWTEASAMVGTPDDSTVGVELSYTIHGQSYEFNITSLVISCFPMILLTFIARMAVALAGGPSLPFARWSSTVHGGKVGGPSYIGNGNFEILNFGDK
jgi:hypothetical protein